MKLSTRKILDKLEEKLLRGIRHCTLPSPNYTHGTLFDVSFRYCPITEKTVPSHNKKSVLLCDVTKIFMRVEGQVAVPFLHEHLQPIMICYLSIIFSIYNVVMQ